MMMNEGTAFQTEVATNTQIIYQLSTVVGCLLLCTVQQFLQQMTTL